MGFSEEKELEKQRFIGTAKGTSIVGYICDECIDNKGKFSVFGENLAACCFSETEQCANGYPYYVFVEKSKNAVVLFSRKRVPFDIPKSLDSTIKGFKTKIRSAVQNLEAFGDCILKARYGTTEQRGFYDVENVLFYNVGTSVFNHLAKNGVVFSKVENKEIIALREKYSIPEQYTHYYEYKVFPNEKTKRFNRLLAKWESISLKCIGLNAEKVWSAFKTSRDKIEVRNKIDTEYKDTFAVLINIRRPKNTCFKVMTAMKPLLDGLICSFHSSSFTRKDLLFLTQKIGCLSETLNDDSTSVLGRRKTGFVQEYRNNLKWNPADDLCDYVFISVEEGDEWKISGQVYSSVKCPHCGKMKFSKLLYGMPAFDEQMGKQEEIGEIKIMGCERPEKMARYYCRWCKSEF